jgi:hypothetical protein
MQVTINVKDRVLLNVIDKMVDRSNNGIDKYSTTLEDDKSGLVFFLKQIQTELMDAVLYMQRLKEEITNMKEEKLLRDIEDIDIYGMETFEIDKGFWVSNTTNTHLNLRNDNSKD